MPTLDANSMISLAGFILTLLSLAVVTGKLLQQMKGLHKDMEFVKTKIEILEKEKNELRGSVITHEQEIKFWKEVVSEIKSAVKEIREEFKELSKDIRSLVIPKK